MKEQDDKNRSKVYRLIMLPLKQIKSKMNEQQLLTEIKKLENVFKTSKL